MIQPKANEITHIQYYLIAQGEEFSYKDYLVPPDSLNVYLSLISKKSSHELGEQGA